MSVNADKSPDRVWTPPNRCSEPKTFKQDYANACRWVDNTFGPKIERKLYEPVASCIDKVAECSRDSLCNCGTTNACIKTSATISKGTCYVSIGCPLACVNCTSKTFLESLKWADDNKYALREFDTKMALIRGDHYEYERLRGERL